MSIEEEIKARKAALEAEKQENARQEQELRKVKVAPQNPRMITPPDEIKPVIMEAIPTMKFVSPKISGTFSDGVTCVRSPNKYDKSDADAINVYSFDLRFYSHRSAEYSEDYSMWIFENGSVAFCISNDLRSPKEQCGSWEYFKKYCKDASTLRSKLIDALTAQAIQIEEKNRLDKALQDAGMDYSTARPMGNPPWDIQYLVYGRMEKMKFNQPKVGYTFQDGIFRVRRARDGEKGNLFSFDVQLSPRDSTKKPYSYSMWIFENKTIVFSDSNGHSVSWQTIEKEDPFYSDMSACISEALMRQDQQKRRSHGCYVATTVYGTYDCPEVWVLRRFRDSVLQQNCLGRLFIKTYYAVSPSLVRIMGGKRWFVSLCRSILDPMIERLKSRGFSDQKYEDRD